MFEPLDLEATQEAKRHGAKHVSFHSRGRFIVFVVPLMTERSFGLAVIGCGRWGINHVRTAGAAFGDELRVVCDADAAARERACALAPRARPVATIDEVLADPSVSAVVVATPAITHHAIARQVLESDRHVLVEKPMALFSEQARELDRLARARQRVLMVGHVLLFHPAIQALKRLIDDGRLGRLQYLYSNRLNLGAVRKEENILWSFAPHDVSVLDHLIGDEPIDVHATGAVFLQPGIHDVTLTTLRYPHNVHAHIHVSWLHPFKEHRLVVIGDRSMAVFEDSRAENKLVLHPKGIDWIEGEPRKREGDFEVVEVASDEPLRREHEHFRDCVLTGREPLTHGRHAISVLEVLERAQRALEPERAASETLPGAVRSTPAEAPFFVHPTAVVDEGATIGEGTRIWHFSHVQPGASIGKGCSIGQNVNIASQVRVGNHVKIQNNVSVYEGVELADYVFCGPSAVFTNVRNPRSEFPQRGARHYVPTRVGHGASIGANATIVCGTTLGRFAFVGAGAVVTRDVPEYALMVGNPARRVGWMCRCGTRLVIASGRGGCERCEREYREERDVLRCVGEGESG